MSPASPRAREHRSSRRLGVILALGALLPWFSACASAPAPGANPAAPAKIGASAQLDPLAAVKKGMTAEQVRALAGEPMEIKPFKVGEFHSEVWVYQRVIAQETRQVAVTTREVPVTNPLTGVTGTVTEPVMSNEFLRTSEITELLMVDRRLIEWKRKSHVDRKID